MQSYHSNSMEQDSYSPINENKQATEVYPMSRDSSMDQLSPAGGACAEYWTSSPSSTSSQSRSTCEEQRSDPTNITEPNVAYTKSKDNRILKKAFKSMVRERHNQGRHWLVLRQAELSKPERPLSRVRSFFGI